MKKFILFTIMIICLVFVFLFCNSYYKEQVKNIDAFKMHPTIELIGENRPINIITKSGNWNYKKLFNKYDTIQIDDVDSKIQNVEPLYYNEDGLILNFDKKPDSVNLQVFLENNLIFEENNIPSKDGSIQYTIFQPKVNGKLNYKIIAIWDKLPERGFYGEFLYEFDFINKVPLEFEVSTTQTYPGEMLTVFAKYANKDEEISIKTDITKTELPFYDYENGKFLVLPLSYDLKPSKYTISLISEERSQEITINVLDKEFPIQYLSISEEVDQSTRNDAAYEEYNKYIGSVRKTDTPKKMWDGCFVRPVEGRITTEFGMRRFINNAPTSYRHSGIDIAADTGTPVKASNSGKVILGRHLMLTGNTVLIDHGYGIISWSYHMDSIQVKEGDEISKGQIIGKVGSTGFSTGPHLHFAVSVHDVFSNPWTLFEQEPILGLD